MNRGAFSITGIIVVCMLNTAFVFTREPGPIQNKKEAAFLFMRLRRMVAEEPRREKKLEAQFSIADYYFAQIAYSEAKNILQEISRVDSPQIISLLTNAYLLKIAELQNDTSKSTMLKDKLFSGPFILLFSDYKAIEYKSLLNNTYKIHHYLDKIEIFLNDQPFAQLSP